MTVVQFPDALAFVDTALPTPLSLAIELAWITVGGKGGKGKSFAPILSDFNMFNRASTVHARNKREGMAVCTNCKSPSLDIETVIILVNLIFDAKY